MIRVKFPILCVACGFGLVAATAASQPPVSQTETAKGVGTVTTDQIKGQVVEVEGNNLLVKLTSGELRTFKVPEDRKFLVDGKELSVHALQPGTTLTATVRTTTTPITVRTRAVQNGKVWFVSAPTVILTLPNGENKQYEVKDDVKFTLNGKPATVFDLKKGMVVSAEKIVEAPDVEITTATTVVGQGPVAAAPASAAAGAAPSAAPPASPGGASATAAASQPAPSTQPPSTAPATEGGSGWMWWAGAIIVILLVVVVGFRGWK